MKSSIFGNPDDESQVGAMLPDDKMDDIVKEYIAQLSVPKKSDRLFLFAPVGLIASGKFMV